MTPTTAQLKPAREDILAFCRCPLPRGQRARAPGQLFRLNLMLDLSELENPRHTCLSCRSTYSIAAPILGA